MVLRCFPHIVNLACKAALEYVTEIQLADVNAPDCDPDLVNPCHGRDTIAILRSLIVTVSD
jgi:hypothetical protein